MKGLDVLWFAQNAQNEKINTFKNKGKEERTKQFVLEIQEELSELLSEMNYKHHRAKKEIIESNIKYEIVDIFKYWLSLALVWIDDPEELIELFERKTQLVYQRYNQEKIANLIEAPKIACVDIDGVLADYPLGFKTFIEAEMNTTLPDPESLDLYYEYGQIIGHEKLRELKHQFRERGYKQLLNVCDGACDFLRRLRAKDYIIILLTARPYHKYKRIWTDTIKWLEDNHLCYDHIIWAEDKNYEALRQFPNMKFMVEDNHEFANKIGKFGYKSYLITRPWNKQWANNAEIYLVDTFNEILRLEGLYV